MSKLDGMRDDITEDMVRTNEMSSQI